MTQAKTFKAGTLLASLKPWSLSQPVVSTISGGGRSSLAAKDGLSCDRESEPIARTEPASWLVCV